MGGFQTGIVFVFLLIVFVGGGEARTFTDIRGRKIDASVVGVQRDWVEMRLDKGGKIYKVHLSKLSKADREYVRLWQEAREAEVKKNEEGKKVDQEDEKKVRRVAPIASKPLALESILFDQGLWQMSTPDFEKKYRPHGFVYMSVAKNDLRSTGMNSTLFGKKAGEVVVRSEGGLIESVSISLYNRGDNGAMSVARFNDVCKDVINRMKEKTGVSPRDMSKRDTINMVRQLWLCKASAIMLEHSLGNEGETPEFIRVRMKAKNAESKKMAIRSSLRDNVVRDRVSGDVFIKGVPMVNQGRKGYCAVASAARVYQYYGLETSQHELAQIAGTGPHSGTSLGEMVASLKKVTRHLHTRVLVMYEFPKGLADKMPDVDSSYQDYDRMIRNYNLGLKEFARDIKNYNKIAKKRGKDQFPDDEEKGVVSIQEFARKCDAAIYREVMTRKSSYPRFKNKIEEYVDQGIPVGWCLQLGMFKEANLPQSYGGHMRLIIGYNEKTEEIIYTDSWGAGHGMKRMPAADAFCMSNALLALPPTK